MSVSSEKETSGGLGETIKVVIQALLLALVVRTFLIQPFSIPSGSMMPTLLVGDYLFVSKFSYGFSRHSFPYSIVPFEGRFWAGAPRRGDIVVFKLPRDNSTDYIKRVIGLPGDRVQMKNGALFLNGEEVPRERADDFVQTSPFGQEVRVPAWRETLPNGVTYITLDASPNSLADNTQEFVVPDGHYFMMGDNRDNSADSRVAGSGVGYVPFENLVGKAQMIFFSIDEDTRPWEVWRWPEDVRGERIFDMLQ
ncbi:signal peptidase I [Methylobrevis pamukkalensis]|uniref:Signal peptidase I n=1 Tax=Methylobrevis pamukkalensis TaxID=1439726 RepID=A0A1E3H272_9HYPH|nr:signal peptidase I [Methylobrevis pamukkalensis]ODN70428.1 Signal peptidase I [Methylobrevis pamukkalensis]